MKAARVPASFGPDGIVPMRRTFPGCRPDALVIVAALGALALSGCLDGGHVVVEPRGGEEWAVGTTHEIKWVSFGISEVRLEISCDGGASWTTIVGSTDAAYGSYSWNVTGSSSTDCYVRVSDAADPSQSATSGCFSIREKVIAVLVPSGDETWYCGRPDRLVTWSSFGVEGDVDLFYSTDAGASWAGIETGVPNDGSYLWTIPDEDSTQCRVMVKEAGGGTLGESAADFTICPAPGVAFSDAGSAFTGVEDCALAWGDYDGDGALDIIVAGDSSGSDEPLTALYRGDGAGGFPSVATEIVDVESGGVAWGDFDGDGDIDLAIAGTTDGTADGAVTEVYCNSGGVFAAVSSSFVGVTDCALAWGDCDNDGDLDLAVAGMSVSGPLTRVYQNTGGDFGAYSAPLADVSRCSLAWGDYDNDGDLDLAVAGEDVFGGCITTIYRNTKDDFIHSGISIIGVKDCSLAWGDYDSDGDLDLAVAGYNDVFGPVCRLYGNNGGVFTVLGSAFVNLDRYSLAWGDYDNDGDLDLAVAGGSAGGGVAKVYRNDGDDFVDAAAAITPAERGSLAWGDYDGDGDLDLAVAGHDGVSGRTSVYRNLSVFANTPPSLPTGLETTVDEVRGIVTFAWNPATDAETPQAGLTYNLVVRDESGMPLYVPGMDHPFTGARLVPAMGNVQHCTTYTLGWLLPGEYTWSVQAVDSALCASPWPPPPPPPGVDADFVCGAMFANVTPQWPAEDGGGGDDPLAGLASGSACTPSGGGFGSPAALCILAAAVVLAARLSWPRPVPP
jgi:hypothetical protein